jgi:hypothetical protein
MHSIGIAERENACFSAKVSDGGSVPNSIVVFTLSLLYGVVSSLTSGQIEVMYTLLGDANLDGLVNAADFNELAAKFNQGVSRADVHSPRDNLVRDTALGHFISLACGISWQFRFPGLDRKAVFFWLISIDKVDRAPPTTMKPRSCPTSPRFSPRRCSDMNRIGRRGRRRS